MALVTGVIYTRLAYANDYTILAYANDSIIKQLKLKLLS